MAVGGMLTVFVFSRLWRRSGVLTDVELVELRYSGRPAAFLRGFRALYLALPINCIVMGWVTSAMLKVLKVTLLGDESSDWLIIAACLAVTGLYAMLSGLWGVAITDMIQFVLAMVGCISLAVIAIKDVGGADALRVRVAEIYGPGAQPFSLLPDFSQAGAWMTLEMFLVYLGVLWWASWYPGAEPGGGGYVVQRMASCRDEKHSLLATLWFQVAHYCIRPWPWLIVAFVALVRHPELRQSWLKDSSFDPGVGFPMMMRELLPPGLRGLMLVAFFAAFMSTLSTQINWGASYLVSDFYRRFVCPKAGQSHLAWAGRAATVLLLVLGGITTTFITSVDQAWKFIAALGAGTGAVFILRWFWWRINAWSEISAMAGSLAIFIGLQAWMRSGNHPDVLKVQEYQTVIVAGLTVLLSLGVTLLTRPETEETLANFYRKVHPGGPGWKPVARQAPDVTADTNLGVSILAAMLGAVIVFSTLPGIGHLIFGNYLAAAGCLALAAACAACIVWLLGRTGWASVAK